MKRKEAMAKEVFEKKPQTLRPFLEQAWVQGYEQARKEAHKIAYESSWVALAARIAGLGEEEVG